MNTDLFNDLDTVDRDGAVRETAEKAGINPLTRRAAIAAGGAGAAAVAVAAVPGAAHAASAKLTRNDIDILNYALTLEYLEAAFYAEALDYGALSGRTLDFARATASHEATHVATITSVIKAGGGRPVARPAFNFKGTNRQQPVFQKTALTLESTGVSAYTGQGARVNSDTILASAVAILAVEARHQA
jgi:hypothetical protein